jgi:hypothetical protein
MYVQFFDNHHCFLQGLGGLLLKELTRRLKDVGLLTLFCWGDQESECFWSKQVCSLNGVTIPMFQDMK